MLKFIKSLFLEKEDWKLVHTIEEAILRTLENDKRDEGTLFYYLYESNRGNRKVEFLTTFDVVNNDKYSLEKNVRSLDTYLRVVKRWLEGRFDPEIQQYSDVKQEEMVHKLKGKVDD